MHLMTGKLNLNNVIRAVIDRPCILWLPPHKWATNGRPYECYIYFLYSISSSSFVNSRTSPFSSDSSSFKLPIATRFRYVTVLPTLSHIRFTCGKLFKFHTACEYFNIFFFHRFIKHREISFIHIFFW